MREQGEHLLHLRVQKEACGDGRGPEDEAIRTFQNLPRLQRLALHKTGRQPLFRSSLCGYLPHYLLYSQEIISGFWLKFKKKKSFSKGPAGLSASVCLCLSYPLL